MPKYTLQLFRRLLDKEPIGFLQEVQKKYEQEYERLADADIGEIEDVMVLYGKESWIYRQAERELFERYGKEKEQELFVSLLPVELQTEWKHFVSQGGSLHDYRHGQVFEDAFTPEENILIENALLETQIAMHDYGINLIEEKTDEYDDILERYKHERDEVLKKIEDLKSLKDKGDKWDDEIDNEVYFFEKGFAELEARPSVKVVQEKIDWYKGQIEAGNG